MRLHNRANDFLFRFMSSGNVTLISDWVLTAYEAENGGTESDTGWTSPTHYSIDEVGNGIYSLRIESTAFTASDQFVYGKLTSVTENDEVLLPMFHAGNWDLEGMADNIGSSGDASTTDTVLGLLGDPTDSSVVASDGTEGSLFAKLRDMAEGGVELVGKLDGVYTHTTTIIESSEFSAPSDNAHNNKILAFKDVSQGDSWQYRIITDYDGTNKRVTLNSALSMTPVNDDQWRILAYPAQFGDMLLRWEDGGALDTILDSVQTDTTAIIAELDNGIDGLGALKALIDAVQVTANDVETDTQDIQSKVGSAAAGSIAAALDHGTYGLSALDTDLGTILTAVQAIQNNTRFVASVPPKLNRPSSGDEAVNVQAFLYNTQGSMENPANTEVLVRLLQMDGTAITDRWYTDSALTLAAGNPTDDTSFPSASGWRKMANSAVGKFAIFYKNDAGHTEENLSIEFGWDEGGNDIFQSRPMQISDAADLDTIESKVNTVDSEVGAIQTDVTSIQGKIDSDLGTNADAASASGSVHAKLKQIDSEVGAVQTDLDNNVGSDGDAASASGSVHAKLKQIDSEVEAIDGIVNSLLLRVPAAATYGSGSSANVADGQVVIANLVTAVDTVVDTINTSVGANLGTNVSTLITELGDGNDLPSTASISAGTAMAKLNRLIGRSGGRIF